MINIITIEREYGCGGGEIAQMVANRLGWKLWDQMLTEEIARLAGHSGSRTTETIYRHELRPVITTGADVMDKIFTGTEREG